MGIAVGRWDGFASSKWSGIEGSGAGRVCRSSSKGDAKVGIAVGRWEEFMSWSGIKGC